MSSDRKKIIQEIIDLYLLEKHPDEHTREQFRAWFAGDAHRREKYEALEKAFEREVRFDPNPSCKVLNSYREITGTTRSPDSKCFRPRNRTALYINEHFDVTILSDMTEPTEYGAQKHIILPDCS